jgi:hemolysin activation/secretion protein
VGPGATIQKTDPPKAPNANGESGRCLGAKGINVVMARVQNAIIERGFVTTRVVAQPQDLRSGVFVMTVVPGSVRAVRLTPDSDPRARTGNAVAVEAGQLLNLRDIEQGLENLKRLPSAEADIQIEPAQVGAGQPAAAPGESDLLIRWVQGRPWRVGASLDDAHAGHRGA